MTEYILGFALALAISLVGTPLVSRAALRYGWLKPVRLRDSHDRPLPRLGGIAITVAILIPTLLLFELNRPLRALLVGVIIVFIVGLIDDLRGLSPWAKLVGHTVAAIVVLAGGLGIILVTNPFSGGVTYLDSWRIPLEIFGFGFNLIPLANVVSILWIAGMINSVNFLDGLDGLAGGVSLIAALTLFVLALTPVIDDQTVALLSLILAGALLGFLPHNVNPARIFMGDGGAYVIGLLLAVLSIYAGSKIAVGVLVLGVAIVDAAWVALRRIMRRKSPFSPDRAHLHHQLLDSGLSQWQVVGYLYLVALALSLSIVFGGAAAGFAVLVLALGITAAIVRFRGVTSN